MKQITNTLLVNWSFCGRFRCTSVLVSSQFDYYANYIFIWLSTEAARPLWEQRELARVVTQHPSRSSSLASMPYRTAQTALPTAHWMSNQVQICLFNLQNITYRLYVIRRRTFTISQAYDVYAIICQSLTFSSTAQLFIWFQCFSYPRNKKWNF